MDRDLRILLVEDDRHLAELMKEYLEQQGFKVSVEPRGDRAVSRIHQEAPDLLLLDLMLPGRDGLSICQEVRSEFDGPILILTARDDDMDQVAGLEMGADDYIQKPVKPRVLLARIRAQLRHRGHDQKTPTAHGAGLQFGKLRICTASRTAHLDGQAVDLGSTEFDLLVLLAKNAGVVMDRDRIFLELRGFAYDGLDRFVDVNILRLRKKLEADPANPRRIKTIWRQGYLFVAEGWENGQQ